MSEMHFLPWMRTGLAGAAGGGGTAGSRSLSPSVNVLVGGAPHHVPGPHVRLRGPGDVLALNTAEIKRRDPEPGTVGAETNFFCSVEFYAPDLPWRYSPSAPDDDRVAPWLVLVVVERGVGVELSRGKSRLPVLSVADPVDQLPDLADSWAWAHLQASASLDGGIAAAFEAEPSALTSRLLCPRRLRPDTKYVACIVPAFAAGREAGLDHAPSTSLDPAWTRAPVELPVYDSWELTAGDRFDFKSLARRIKPAELPSDVGFRDLDLTDVATGIRPVRTPATFVGAMHAPADALVYWHDGTDRAQFEHDIRGRLVTTPPRGAGGGAYDPLLDDPVVAPPAHGAPQVGTNVVPDSSTDHSEPGKGRRSPAPGWFEELNIAPHHRAVAGIGAEVVRADQEALMAAAWEQARPVLAVNRALNRGRLAEEAARQGERKWNGLEDAVVASIAAPAFVQMRVDGTTAKRRIAESDAPSAYFGAAFRRLGRAGGPLATGAAAAAARAPAIAITRSVVAAASGSATGAIDPLSNAFRTRYLLPGMDVGAGFSDLTSEGTIDVDVDIDHPVDGLDRAGRVELRRRAAAVPVLVPAAPPGPGAARTRTIGAGRGVDAAVGAAHGIELDLQPFEYEVVRPITAGRVVTTPPGPGAVEIDITATVRASVTPRVAIIDSVRSNVVVPPELWSTASIPTRIGLQPRFTDPMYERVRALSVDYLVPGVGSVADNTLSLLEINPAYVEAFLVGLNHEMSRELRWREYPAELGQTWFQHFFDNVDPPGGVDVRPIDEWNSKEALGHEFSSGRTPGLVALIKADLIRKFPDVRVYAVPAELDADGVRVPDTNAEPLSPSFVGTLQRGTTFYGFESLTEEDAAGDGPGEGWFFVLEEEPRAMRFGLDRGRSQAQGKQPTTWANLAWTHLAEEGGAVPWFCSIHPPNDHIDDAVVDGLAWGHDAAVMAAITFRRPMQVFMHASAMLPAAGDG